MIRCSSARERRKSGTPAHQRRILSECNSYKAEERVQHKRACDLAMSDYLSAPVIQDVDASAFHGVSGDVICVQARDDFRVDGVEVVDEIDLSTYGGKIGDKIRVRASDDVEVKGVTVEIRAQAGAVL